MRPSSHPAPRYTPPPTVDCDLCGAAMALPANCIEQEAILGLLVCTACIEDHLEAQSHERSCH